MQRRFAPTANELEHLNDKFNFANAACAEFDIVGQTTSTHFTGNHPFHVAQRLNHAEIDVTTENKRAQHRTQLVSIDAFAIAHNPRLDHRVTLPVAPLLLVIIFQRGKAQHQRATFAKRTQPHIHAIDEAILRWLIQHFNQPLPHAGKKLRVIQFPASTLRTTMFRPGKNQIDIRGEIQFPAAQLTHA